MNILIYGDLHITSKDLEECYAIIDEIVSLVNKHHVEHIINLGDTFDILKPSSKELDLFSEFVLRVGECRHDIIVAKSHESSNTKESILNHFEVLRPGKIFLHEELMIDNAIYCGHYIINESKKNFGSKKSAKELSQYNQVYLGHQHAYQIIKPNICHLGSCRWVDFGELEDKKKLVCLIENFGEKTQKTHFLALLSPYKIYQINLGETLEKTSQIGACAQNMADFEAIANKIPKKSKVKIKINDFGLFSEFILKEEHYKSLFYSYLRETSFKEAVSKHNKKDIVSIEEYLYKYLKDNNIEEKIGTILIEEFKKKEGNV